MFRVCSVLTQMWSFSWSHHGESCSIMSMAVVCTHWVFILNQRCSCALTSVQGVFSSDTNENFLMVTPWWVTFNNDSKAHAHSMGVQDSLIGVHAHSQVLRGCSILTYWHSRALTSVTGVFNTDSKVFKCTHKRSWRVQFWHKWELFHGHTIVSHIQ